MVSFFVCGVSFFVCGMFCVKGMVHEVHGFPVNVCVVSVTPVFYRCSLHMSDLCICMRELISSFSVLREGSQFVVVYVCIFVVICSGSS